MGSGYMPRNLFYLKCGGTIPMLSPTLKSGKTRPPPHPPPIDARRRRCQYRCGTGFVIFLVHKKTSAYLCCMSVASKQGVYVTCFESTLFILEGFGESSNSRSNVRVSYPLLSHSENLTRDDHDISHPS